MHHMGADDETDVATRRRIAANLRALRYMHKFESDAAMAKALGMSRSSLNRILKDERPAGLAAVVRVHRRLHVSIDWLVDRDPAPEWFNPDYTPDS